MPGPGVHYVFNASKPVVSDPKVRQALILATNQDTILKTVYLSQGAALHTLLSDKTACWDKASQEMYLKPDPEKAKALLDEAGWKLDAATGLRKKDGKTLTIGITSVAIGKGPDIGVVVQSQWSALGIDARNITLPTSSVQLPTAQAGDFDVIWRDFGATDPNILSTLFHGKNLGVGKGWNFSHIAMPELDALLDKGDVTVDPVERCKVYAEAQKYIQDRALTIPIRPRIAALAGLPQVKDLRIDPAIGSIDIQIYDAYVGTK
jgi:peptide/nickel transport system substrate-binding protein